MLLTISAFFLFSLSPYALQQARAEICNQIVAIVNQEILTQKELQSMIESFRTEMYPSFVDPNFDSDRMGQEALWTLIDERLQLQEAEREDITVRPEEIDEGIREIRMKNRLNSDQDMERIIESQHMTMESLRQKIKTGIILMKIQDRAVRSKVQLSDAEIIDYFTRQNNGETESIRISHILFSLPEDAGQAEEARIQGEAQRVLEEVQKGREFSLAARQYSQDLDTAQRGGDLGYLRLDQMSLPFQQEIARLQTGQTSQPVRTSFGFHLIQITDRKTSQLVKGSEQWNEIKADILSQKAQKYYQQWREELRKQAYIEIKAEKPVSK